MAEKTMWWGNVRHLPFGERIATTVAAGCDTLAMTPYDFCRWQVEGLSSGDMLRMAEDAGIRLSNLDPLSRWAPSWIPNNVDPKVLPHAFFGFTGDDFFRIADTLHVNAMSAIVTCPSKEVSVDTMTEAFARLCDRAADFGIRCDLEFIPFWGLTDLETAWAIVKGADRPNGALMFDVWHYLRSKPNPELLASIPGDRIGAVQVSDATESLPPGVSLLEDCMQRRLPPGQGEFPLIDILRQLDAIGGLNCVGAEIFSERFDSLEGAEIARLCRTSMAHVLDAAGVSHTFQRE